MNPYSNRKIIKYFKNGISGNTCLLEGNIVRKIYITDTERRMFKEIRALKLLHDHPHFPKILFVDKNIVYMEYVGIPIINLSILPIDYQLQLDEIINSLKECDIFHQDIILDHITVLNNILYLIDFEKSMTTDELNFAKKLRLPTWNVLRYTDVSYIKNLVENFSKKRKSNTTIYTV